MAVGAERTAGTGRNHQWVLTLLPTFPLVLLVLRLYYLSRQNLQTMLLLVQFVSPLGLVSAMLITLVWAVPLVILVLRLFGSLATVSARAAGEPYQSWLTRAVERIPDWVVAFAVLLALVTWQLRFLPSLLMVVVAIVALAARARREDGDPVVVAATVVAPVLAAIAAYVWLGPGIVAALAAGEPVTALLLALPPVASLLLTAPLPGRPARLLTHLTALGLAMVTPFLVGVIFLRAPILPAVAVEVGGDGQPTRVVRGHVITVDDRLTTLLDEQGDVQFVPNVRVLSQTLCPDSAGVPTSAVAVRGWRVEEPALHWVGPRQRRTPDDPRCAGRPLAARR